MCLFLFKKGFFEISYSLNCYQVKVRESKRFFTLKHMKKEPFLWKAQKQDALLVKVVHKEMAFTPPVGGIIELRQDKMCNSIICLYKMIKDQW